MVNYHQAIIWENYVLFFQTSECSQFCYSACEDVLRAVPGGDFFAPVQLFGSLREVGTYSARFHKVRQATMHTVKYDREACS